MVVSYGAGISAERASLCHHPHGLRVTATEVVSQLDNRGHSTSNLAGAVC